MSLQLWLPLDGNLNNHGLLNASSNANVTYSAGKIGKQSLKSSTKAAYDLTKGKISTRKMSVSFWGKADTYTGTSTQWWQTCSFTCNDASAFHVYCVPNERYKMEYKPELNAVCDTKTWRHVTYVLDGTTIIAYIDGAEVGRSTTTNADRTLTQVTIGCAQVCINDFRIYDHVLSLKEIQELSQGLILHLPLDNNGMGGVNLLKGGYKVVSTKDGHTPKGSLTFDTSIMPLNNLIGKKITFSFDYKCTGTKLNATGDYTKDRYGFHLSMQYVNASGSNANAYPCASYLEPIGEGRAIQTYQVPADAKSISGLSVAIQPYNLPAADSDHKWYLRNIKLEIGDKATPYSPNPNDILDSILTVDETSGYNHNCYAYQIMNITTDTPRYDVSTTWIDNNDFIYIDNFYNNGQTVDTITIAGWYKATTINGTNPNFFNFGANNFIRGRIISTTSLWSYWNINGTKVDVSATAPSTIDGNWHHYAFSFNKGIVKIYFDGVLKNTVDHSSTGTVLKCEQISEWGLGGYTPTKEKFLGNQSDFRVYCTALSDDAILELYEGRPGVDKQGQLHVAKINEYFVPATAVKKTGVIMATNTISEDNIDNLSYSTWKYDNASTASYTPKKDTSNSCLNGFKVVYGDPRMNGKRVKIKVKVDWNGFDSTSTAGTFTMRFQGAFINDLGNGIWSSRTGVSNAVCDALNNKQNLTNLVLSKSNGSYIYETECVIKSGIDQGVIGHFIGIRTDYSNGIGTITLSDLTITPVDHYVDINQPFKISKDSIAANYIIEC